MSIFDLCNRAVSRIGGIRLDLNLQAQVNALNYAGLIASNAQQEAIACVRHFPATRDSLLQAEPWVFSTRTATPARLAVPLPNWPFSFALPTDCLKLLAVTSQGMELPLWSQEGQIVSCDREPVTVRFTSRVPNIALWPPLFAEAVELKLAADICVTTQGTMSAKPALIQLLANTIDIARKAGLINSLTSLPLDDYAWDSYTTGARF